MKDDAVTKTVLQYFVFAFVVTIFFFRDKPAKRAIIFIGTDVKRLITHRLTHLFLLLSFFLKQAKRLGVKHYHQTFRFVIPEEISTARASAYFTFRILNHNTCIYSSKHSMYALSNVFYTPEYQAGGISGYRFTHQIGVNTDIIGYG